MQNLKVIYYATLYACAWITNDQKGTEEYKENMLVNRVSMQVRHYRIHFFNQ